MLAFNVISDTSTVEQRNLHDALAQVWLKQKRNDSLALLRIVFKLSVIPLVAAERTRKHERHLVDNEQHRWCDRQTRAGNRSSRKPESGEFNPFAKLVCIAGIEKGYMRVTFFSIEAYNLRDIRV